MAKLKGSTTSFLYTLPVLPLATAKGVATMAMAVPRKAPTMLTGRTTTISTAMSASFDARAPVSAPPTVSVSAWRDAVEQQRMKNTNNPITAFLTTTPPFLTALRR